MKHTVHILTTVRNPALLEAALLTFRTLRVGFPTAQIAVWGNGLSAGHADAVAAHAVQVGGAFFNLAPTSHDAWIEGLLVKSTEPFWIADTDLVFHRSIEAFALAPETILAGRYEPAFVEDWTASRHVDRLHTCLLWFDPSRVRAAMHGYIARFPAPWRNTAQYPFVRQHFIPDRRGTRCYDTCAGLWQAGIGTAFTPLQDSSFDHLSCATYVDLIAPSMPDVNLLQGHAAVYADPARAKGIKVLQDQWYARHAVPETAPAVAEAMADGPAALRAFMAGQTDDELIRLSHQNRDRLRPLLARVKDGAGLEIGAWKGESTVWFLEQGLAHMDVIEPFTGNVEHKSMKGVRAAFARNIKPHRDRVLLIDRPSGEALPTLLAQSSRRYDFIYVDGSHESRDVVLDACYGFQLLRPGGLMAFDDYLFEYHDNLARNPRAAIDFFLASHAAELTVLAQEYQVVIQKKGDR